MISIVIPWRPGCPHRERSLARVETHLRTVFGGAELVHADDGGEPFARGASIDQAVAVTSGDVIVVCDADLIVPAETLTAAVVAAVETEPGLVVPFDRYLYLTRRQTERIVSDRALRLPHRPHAEWSMAGSVGGCGALDRRTFETAGGYDRRFRGWGCEDYAFAWTVETLAGPVRHLPAVALHLWHPVDPTNDPNRPGYHANVALMHRYAAARGDPPAMRALIAEQPCPQATRT